VILIATQFRSSFIYAKSSFSRSVGYDRENFLRNSLAVLETSANATPKTETLARKDKTSRSKEADATNQQDLINCSYKTCIMVSASSTNSDMVTAACTFCDTKIIFGESVCPSCMKKYNIKTYDLDSDGCGCDR
jgi:hypothetical protein